MKSLITRLAVVAIMLVAGVALFTFAATPTTETVTRQRAILSMAPGQATSQNDAATEAAAEESTVVAAVVPNTVDFSTVKIDTTETENSMRNRYLRGEIDFAAEGIIGAAQIADMKREALAQPVDADVQIVGPGENAPTPAGVAFDSIDYTEAGGSVPPDPEMAAGLNHLIATVNVAVEIYDKSGNSVFGPTAAANLFNSAPCDDSTNLGLYDPNVIYDEEEDRWILAYDIGAFETDGGYCLLASQTGDPTGLWYEYFFPINTATSWMDYPHAGVGDEFIFMGANYFTYSPGSFDEAKLHAWNKADLYAGNPVVTVIRSLVGTDTPQPLNLHGASTNTWPEFGNEHYFLGEPYDGTYTLLQWNPVTDDLTNLGNIDLGATSQPIESVQDGTVTLDAGDWRPLDFEYRNGHGWTANTVSCNPGDGTVNCVRWAQINLATAAFGPAGFGTIASDGEYRQHPDLAVSHCDEMVIGYTKSSATTWPSVYVTGRRAMDAANTVEAEVLVKEGEIDYVSFQSSTAPNRWGDYTGMTIDPDGTTFWYLGQYSKDTGTTNGRWGNWIASFEYSDNTNCTLAVDMVGMDVSAESTPSTTTLFVTATVALSLIATAFIVRRRTA